MKKDYLKGARNRFKNTYIVGWETKDTSLLSEVSKIISADYKEG